MPIIRSGYRSQADKDELAAREMGRLSLEQTLQLVVLYAEQDDPRAERATSGATGAGR